MALRTPKFAIRRPANEETLNIERSENRKKKSGEHLFKTETLGTLDNLFWVVSVIIPAHA